MKALYDYVVNGEKSRELKSIGSGMRVAVGRGGPLDIGMYHKKSRDGVDRNRMTIELWTQFTPTLPGVSKNPLGNSD